MLVGGLKSTWSLQAAHTRGFLWTKKHSAGNTVLSSMDKGCQLTANPSSRCPWPLQTLREASGGEGKRWLGLQ